MNCVSCWYVITFNVVLCVWCVVIQSVYIQRMRGMVGGRLVVHIGGACMFHSGVCSVI